jgi:glycosyltransferase involved in cell wall biosynthesis
MSRVLVISHDYVRRSMAGPGIRCFELARQLHLAGQDVVLAAPNSTDLDPQPFPIEVWHSGINGNLQELSRGTDVIVVQGFVLEHNMFLAKSGARLVVDLYDPFHVEFIASYTHDAEANKVDWLSVLATLNDQLRMGDFFLCASERQRDFWLGMLSALNRVTPVTYAADATLRSMIDLVPFGISTDPPVRREPRIRGRVPGIGDGDFLLLWGGGIYNWFDPLTPIRAIARLAPEHPELKLFFLATRHPSPDVPEMSMASEAVALAGELGVLDRNVFFSQDWVPYAERADWLLEADAGISTHQDHLETRYSYRTRILDYFWCGLPTLCTAGDSLADLIEARELGLTVPPQDEDAICAAMVRLLTDGEGRAAMSARTRESATEMTWDRAARPLIRYCENPTQAPDRVAIGDPTRAVYVPIRGDDERAELARGYIRGAQNGSLPTRVARILASEGPAGVASRVRRRLRR